MGTTIRRQPITTSIPASPDYKFLNITNFGGVQKSSNPFVVSSNTASDCLNVYVDEDNALSTRPRLQLKYDLVSLANVPEGFETIGVYDLHDGYLLHGVVGTTGYMYKFVETELGLETPNTISGTIPTIKCVIFEQNEIIYVLTGKAYKQIKNNTISDVIGYVPTTTIGKWEPRTTKNSDGVETTTYQTAGKSYESRNLLSDKYKETYFWDGTWNIGDVVEEGDVVENNYIKHKQHEITTQTQWIQDDTVVLQYIRGASENSENYNYYLAFNPVYDYENDYNLLVLTTTKENRVLENLIVQIPMSVYDRDVVSAISSDDGKTIVVAKKSDDDFVADGIHVFKRDSVSSATFTSRIYSEEQGAFGSLNGYVTSLDMSDSGKYITYLGSLNLVLIDTENQTSTVLRTYETNGHFPILIWLQRKSPNKLVLFSKGTTSDVKDKWELLDLATLTSVDLPIAWDDAGGEALTGADIGLSDKSLIGELMISAPGSSISAFRKIIYIPDIINNSSEYVILDTRVPKGSSALSGFVIDDNNRLAYRSDYFKNIGWIYDLENRSVLEYVYYDTLTMARPYAVNGVVYGTKVTTGLKYSGLHEDYLSVSSTEPQLTIIKNYETDNLTTKLTESTLVQRFDNNTWFASGNTTFHTLYNNPTYIPLSSYNDLGEDYEEITGLSIVNDNILAAYKRNKIYIITPITVGNELTYSYTETKNVVGNDVVGAPILTILTEMPTIVSYDGIYALNQLENVQSSDRITTLISENINPLWLKESKSDIDGCQTLNRLYWTYYMLPHEKVDDEKEDYTKVYLLDNRSQQWYYWELPMLVMDSMVKDNKTHLVNSDGVVFTLETSDLINEYNPDVTEYYDKVNDEKRIIPWHWYSQILSLNTINYSKKLIDTTFILTDTDTQDEYALDYNFIAWRKAVSETNATTISNNINYVQSTTKRTMIPRFNFIQIRLSNTEEDLDNNKLRLVGLGLKYVLLEGLY